MATLQIKIDDQDVLSAISRKAASLGLSKTSYARMLIYSDINYPDSDIEAGIADVEAGRVSPTFENMGDAIAWLNRKQ